MESLPGEILFDIFSRLPIKPLMRCRCVCKPWRNLARDPRFIQSHLRRSSLQHPGLILTSSVTYDTISFNTQLHFLHSSGNNNYTCEEVNISLPNFSDFYVVGSCNGLLWLVHRSNRGISYVCNPFTRNYIVCPFSTRYDNRPVIKVFRGFGFCPKSKKFKVVEMVEIKMGSGIINHMEVYVCTLGDGLWRLVGTVPYLISSVLSPQVLVNGALHWVSCVPKNLILAFGLADEVVTVVPHYPEADVNPKVDEIPSVYTLGSLSGCLSATHFSFSDHVDIWVMKDYGFKESWTKCFSIRFNEIGWNLRHIRTLGFFENGELLMMYNNQVLISYNSQTMSLTKLWFSGLPPWFEAVNHVGSLISPSN